MTYEILQNGTRLYLDRSAFPLSTDAVLLADFARPPRGAAVCDLCAGSGAVGLLLLDREPELSVTALELQESACALMERSRAENRLETRFRVLRGDLRQIRSLLPAGSFTQVLCNPPYYPVSGGFAPRDQVQALARTELCCGPGDYCAAAGWLLKTGGSFWLVHRPERLAELCRALSAAGLELKRLRPVCPGPERAPSLLLLQAVRGGKPGLAWDPPLILAKPDGSPTAEYRRIYRLPPRSPTPDP